jgi:heat-inducible transcriptional repressor
MEMNAIHDKPSQPADPLESAVTRLNERSREIFRQIVDAYVETGEPIGSRTVSQRIGADLSPATIRNVMADLEDAGLLYSPHTSAGRLPTAGGLRLFVDALLEIGDLTEGDRVSIDSQCAAAGRSVEQALEEATSLLSGLSHCAGLVLAPKAERALKHFEFVSLGPDRALVVMVMDNGLVENRIIEVPIGTPNSTLVEANNYLCAKLAGRTLQEARDEIQRERDEHRTQLDSLASTIVEAGVATWSGDTRSLIVRGQARLLEDVTAVEDLERIRLLFEMLEAKESYVRLIEAAESADGVQIFIGAENQLFNNTGCAMVITPYANSQEQIVGAIGVIGPSRMNYARIIPLVDYTARVVGRMIG